MDESSGSTVHDSSGNGNTGTLTYSPTWTTGKINNAIDFDGSGGSIMVGDVSVLKPTAAITVSAWIHWASDSPSDYPIVAYAENWMGGKGYVLGDLNGGAGFSAFAFRINGNAGAWWGATDLSPDKRYVIRN